MSMTISIFKTRPIFLGLLLLFTRPDASAVAPGASSIPADSFIVLSLKGESILQKSGILESEAWTPILARFSRTHPDIHEVLLDRNSSGLKFQAPLQFFARMGGGDSPSPSFGIIAFAQDPAKADQTLAMIAKTLGLSRKKGKGNEYRKEGSPLGIGRKGRICYLLGVTPTVKAEEGQEAPSIDERLDELTRVFHSNEKDVAKFPSSLKAHLSRTSDLALYLDGTGLSELVEDFWPDDQWKNLLPALDPLFNRQIGLNLQSSRGAIKVTASEFTPPGRQTPRAASPLAMTGRLPGDAPLVARWSLPEDSLRAGASEAMGHLLKFMSAGKLDKDSVLPGFDASATELLDSPSGDFVLAGGTFKALIVPNEDSLPTTELKPSFVLGFGLSKPHLFSQFLAGLNMAKSLDTLLYAGDLHLSSKKDAAWLSTFDYLREIRADKPIAPLSKYRTNLLNQHAFALDLNLLKANRSLRELKNLTYEQFKTLHWLGDFSRLTVLSGEKGNLTATVKLTDKERQGWEVVAKHLGQETIDSTNRSLYQAIIRDDFNAIVQEVRKGALINANDRFGHTPLHFTAFRGNARILQFLLRNGGDPNARGRHESTPLHSAAWGRNLQALEVLLEEGADVDARTDEGETPGMTAALRGEKDVLEILFALSADPHAVDDHGTNLIDLAAAGGHRVIVELLQKIGVKNKNPLHVAAGLGDLAKVKELLKKGRKVNERDSFGATPLLIAMVAGQEKMVDLLLSRKADPKINAREGYTLMHGAAFSGKKSMVSKALSLGLEINPRYGSDGITPTDVAEDEGDALPYLRALGGRTAWELGNLPEEPAGK